MKRWDRSAFFVDRALDFLRRNRDGHRPSFAQVWVDDPHTPWVLGPDAPKGETPENLRDVLEGLDHQVGRLVDGIRQMGLGDDTLILLLSDNGPLPPFGTSRTAGLRGSKLSLYEGGLRVPLIAAWPGHVPAGRVDDRSVISAVDFLPTLAAIAGAGLPEEAVLDGEDRAAALTSDHPPARSRPLFWEYGRNDDAFKYPAIARNRSPQLAIRDGRWKCLVNADGSGVELYDVAAQPAESVNQAAQHPDVARDLADRAVRWRKSLP